jgi:hypothetical protein
MRRLAWDVLYFRRSSLHVYSGWSENAGRTLAEMASPGLKCPSDDFGTTLMRESTSIAETSNVPDMPLLVSRGVDTASCPALLPADKQCRSIMRRFSVRRKQWHDPNRNPVALIRTPPQ